MVNKMIVKDMNYEITKKTILNVNNSKYLSMYVKNYEAASMTPPITGMKEDFTKAYVVI